MFSWFKGSRTVVALAALLLSAESFAQEPATTLSRLRITANFLLPSSTSEVALFIRPLDRPGEGMRVHFRIPGDAYVQLAPGRYQLSSEQPLRSGAGWLMWDLEIPVTEAASDVSLTEQNAVFFSEMPDLSREPNGPASDSAKRESTENPGPASASQQRPRPSSAPLSTNDATPASADVDQQPTLQPPVDISSPRTPLERSVVQLLNQWVSAVRRHDINELMACYAPHLSRYFLKENVSAALVRRDKENFFQKYPAINKLELRDVRIYPTAEGADVTLTKSWEFSGNQPFSGEVVSTLKLQNTAGRWMISSERERGIWVSRSPDRAIVFVKVKPSQ